MIDKVAFEKTVFQDSALNAQFKSEGFVVIKNFLSDKEVLQLSKYYDENPAEKDSGFHTTLHDNRPLYRKGVTNEVNRVFYPKAKILLKEYKPVFSCFTVKEPDSDSGFDLHLDWSMVDEKQFSSITIWSPLTDITDTNGHLWILPKSHQFEYTIRGGPGLKLWCEKQSPEVSHRYSIIDIKLAKGDAIIYDHRLFHGSPANQSENRRIAINYSSIPAEAKSLHYQFTGHGQVDALEVPDDFYHTHILNTLPSLQNSVWSKKIGGSFIFQHAVNKLISGESIH